MKNTLKILSILTVFGLSALPAMAATYVESAGTVSIEGEHYDSKTTALSRSWNTLTDSTASGSVAMVSSPDSGTTAAAKAGPALVYKVKIVNSGSYYINVRGKGPDGSGDSVYAAFDTASAKTISLSTSWVWKQAGTFTLAAGTHTLYVWMREDGSIVDKVVASKSSTLPTGTGPAESAIDGVSSSSVASSVASSSSSSAASSLANSALISGLSVYSYSAQQTGNEAYNLYDNDLSANTGARWSAEGFPNNVVIDLGKEYDCDKVMVYPYGSRPYQYTVQFSTSPTSGFVTKVNRSANTTSAVSITDTFTPARARYVKLDVTGIYGNTSTWTSIIELRVYGQAAVVSSSSVASSSSSVASSSSSSVVTSSYPFGILNLANWKITVPYDGSDSGSYADEIKRPTLDTYSNTGWFWADSDKIWVNFYCPAGAPTTEGSDNPRCELREMNADGTDEIAWSMTTTTVYRQDGICKVTATPSSGKLAFAQIHSTLDSYDDIIRVQVRLSGTSHVLYVMGSCVDDQADDIRTQAVGSEIVYAIEASSNQVRLYLDGSSTPVRTYANDMTKSPTNYFKAGNYLQSKPSSGYGLVKYRYLKTNK
jgi:hypothetical protein